MKYWIILLLITTACHAQTITRIQGEKFAATAPDSGIAIGQHYDILRQNSRIGTAQVIALRPGKAVFQILQSSDLIEIGDLLRRNTRYQNEREIRRSFTTLGVIFSAAGIVITASGLKDQNYEMNSHNAGQLAGGSALTMSGLILLSKGLQK